MRYAILVLNPQCFSIGSDFNVVTLLNLTITSIG